MKYSKQRELILQALKDNPVHPTADCLYSCLKDANPELSLATVYRNLNLLADNGIINRVSGLDGSAHFDHNTHKHYHFICSKCNKVYDVPYDIAPDLEAKTTAATGLKTESADVVLHGICPDCQKLYN